MGRPRQGYRRVGRERSGCFLYLRGGRSGTILEKVSASAGSYDYDSHSTLTVTIAVLESVRVSMRWFRSVQVV